MHSLSESAPTPTNTFIRTQESERSAAQNIFWKLSIGTVVFVALAALTIGAMNYFTIDGFDPFLNKSVAEIMFCAGGGIECGLVIIALISYFKRKEFKRDFQIKQITKGQALCASEPIKLDWCCYRVEIEGYHRTVNFTVIEKHAQQLPLSTYIKMRKVGASQYYYMYKNPAGEVSFYADTKKAIESVSGLSTFSQFLESYRKSNTHEFGKVFRRKAVV